MNYNQLAEQFLSSAKPSRSQVMSHLNVHSHGEHQVLFYLYKNSGKATVPSEIANYTYTSTARIATILNNLEEKGMVTREISREDRRKILVAITDKGRHYAKETRDEVIEYMAKILEAMGEEKARNFVESFKLFLELGKKIIEEEADDV